MSLTMAAPLAPSPLRLDRVTGADLRGELVAAGRERSRSFEWRRCAAETVRVLERVGEAHRPVALAAARP